MRTDLHAMRTANTFLKDAFEREPFDVLAALLPSELKAGIMADMPRNGLTTAERQAQLARLDQQIDDAEVVEESVIRELEASGSPPIMRRADARPDLLLAPNRELGL